MKTLTVVKFRAKAQTPYPALKGSSVFAPIDRGASPSHQASDHHGVDHLSPRLLRESRPHLPPSRLYPGCLFGSPTVETQNPCQPPLSSAQTRATGGTRPQKRKNPATIKGYEAFSFPKKAQVTSLGLSKNNIQLFGWVCQARAPFRGQNLLELNHTFNRLSRKIKRGGHSWKRRNGICQKLCG